MTRRPADLASCKPQPTLVVAALLLALGVNVGMLVLSAALRAMMIRWFVVARRSRTAG